VKFKLDEHLPVDLLDDLRRDGHDALSVVDEGLSGADDAAVMVAVQSERRCLLTMDKGMANVTIYPPRAYSGIVLFRPHQTGRGAVLRFIRQHLSAVIPLGRAGRADRGLGSRDSSSLTTQ